MAMPLDRFLGKPLDQLTVVGGGANSNVWCQIFADLLGITILQMEASIQANGVGAGLNMHLCMHHISERS
jgi:xylulokinase